MALTAIPSNPVLGWATFAGARASGVPCVLDAGAPAYVASGEAATAAALALLGIGAGERVLVPTYHCPTMIAPVVRAGADAAFFPVDADGAPDLDRLARADLAGVRAMIAAHYFGFPLDLEPARRFCAAHRIALIEDCAHAFFGAAGGVPVGTTGEFAIASLPKFFPVAEGGCLVSRTQSPPGLGLRARGLLDELRAALDAIEYGARACRFGGVNSALLAGLAAKDLVRGRGPPRAPASRAAPAVGAAIDVEEVLRARRYGLQATRVTRWIVLHARRARIVANRRANYRLYASLLGGLPGAAPLRPELPEGVVPYVFPLRVADPDARYRALRAAGAPLVRWELRWPGTPVLPGDAGAAWSREVFQIACHQDLSEDEVRRAAADVRRVLESTR